MKSRVNAQLQLRKQGKAVAVKGPISDWEGDELAAIISVVIAQRTPAGETVVAQGTSGSYANGYAGNWHATADVSDPGVSFAAGAAKAFAVAAIHDDDGDLEWYWWDVPTTLVDS
jgi:hypothetical protein